MNKATESKARLLEAAAQIVERRGAAHLTIDAVAAEAGMSKGGVLYHFPSKHALLEAMLSSLLMSFEARVSRHRIKTEGSAISAWILAEQGQTSSERSMALALLANAAEDPSLLNPVRGLMKTTFAEVRKEASDKDLDTIILLAAEGLRFLDMLNLLPISDRDRFRLHNRLLSLAGNGIG
jgi:AcrR family transcriptional regulator